MNKYRNIYRSYVKNTDQKIDEETEMPRHTIIIKNSLRNVSSKKSTPSFHKFIYEHCGDNDT